MAYKMKKLPNGKYALARKGEDEKEEKKESVEALSLKMISDRLKREKK